LDPFQHQFWAAIGVAALCGAIVGLERQIRGKPAGIRTSILICMGTMVFIKLATIWGADKTAQARVLGQVVVGVGFLGAGVMLAREGLVRGVTSAAVIWVLAAIGATVGFGYYWTAVVLSLLTVGTLSGVQFLEQSVRHLRRGDYSNPDDAQDRG
jgi:putative Mg2+ transporter-C (MgtC) family protein